MMPAVEVSGLEESRPGFVARRIAVVSSYINGRLRKRYGNNGAQNSLPLGQTPPVLEGDTLPTPTLQGRPTLGSLEIVLIIDGSGTFKWSKDGGATFVALGVAISSSVALPGTGMTVVFGSGSYTVGARYQAAPPVLEFVLGWITTLVTDDCYRARGRDTQDPTMVDLRADVERTLADIKEAADSKDGLFDLPVSEDLDSAVTTGGPLGYSETSPYVASVIERNIGQAEDRAVNAATGIGGFNE